MAIIHNTTMSPGKLELLADWLPAQPWYLDSGREPELTKAGGFRFDDPQGEVGMVETTSADGAQRGQLIVRINRILQPADGDTPVGEVGQPCLSAIWRLPDRTQVRGILATAQYMPVPAARP